MGNPPHDVREERGVGCEESNLQKQTSHERVDSAMRERRALPCVHLERRGCASVCVTVYEPGRVGGGWWVVGGDEWHALGIELRLDDTQARCGRPR